MSEAEWRRPRQFLKELRNLGLSVVEATKLTELMARYARGESFPRDHKKLRDGVHELRMSGLNRTVRLYFGEMDGSLVLLCLHIHAKKKNNDRDAVDLAAQRLRNFLNGSWGDFDED